MEQKQFSNIPTRFRHRILDPPSEQPNPSEQPFELSEHDIFSTTQSPSPSPKNTPSHNGILAVLNNTTRSRSNISPVFNHKASSSSNSPSTSILMIPKRPLPPVPRLFPQSAPVNVPVIPFSVRGKSMELEEVVSEVDDDIVVPPHELVDSRDNRLMLSCSVLEGAGRTLKGRDLRQVRNAIWRRTGFID